MRIFKLVLKIIGSIFLVLILFVGTIALSYYLTNDTLQLESVEETKDTFGIFTEGEIIKKDKINLLNTFGLKSFGQILRVYDGLNEVNIYRIAYKSDGLIVTGIMVTPKEEGNYPCLIYNRGGNRNYGALNLHHVIGYMMPYARGGYVVIASNYRGNLGSEGQEEFGGSDVNDVLNLIPALETIEGTDVSRIGMLGHSRGGMMTYQALKKHGIFSAAVIVAGTADAFASVKARPGLEQNVHAQLIPDYAENKTQALTDRSAVYWPEQLDSIPLLIIHGTADDRVHYSQAKQISQKLDSLNRPYQLVSYEGDDHVLKHHKQDYRQKALVWLDRFVKESEPFVVNQKEVLVND